MKKENTAIRLKTIMNMRGLRQVDILNLTVPYCQKYSVKMNKLKKLNFMLTENGRRDITQIIQKLEPERRYQVGIRL